MDKVILLEVSADERERLALLAQQRGYKSLDDYLRALINADAEQHGNDMPFDDVVDDIDIRESIKQGLREAFRDEVVPLESLWTDDDE